MKNIGDNLIIMLNIALFRLLLVFLLAIGLVTIILGCISKWRENTYATFFTYGFSNWITFLLLLTLTKRKVVFSTHC